eukprot:SAG22_NODE_1187_length_5217_cov_5.282532_2_plen_340_part_00
MIRDGSAGRRTSRSKHGTCLAALGTVLAVIIAGADAALSEPVGPAPAAMDATGQADACAAPPAAAGDGQVTAVYGGSFSPLHIGHAALVHRLCALPATGKVVVVPAGRSPGRSATAAASTQMAWELRFQMAQAVFAAGPVVSMGGGGSGCNIEVSDVERPTADGRPNFTDDTLARLQAQAAGAAARGGGGGGGRWALVLGEDAATSFPRWRGAGAIAAAAAIWVVRRPPAAGRESSASGSAGGSAMAAAVGHLLGQPVVFDEDSGVGVLAAAAGEGGAAGSTPREVVRWLDWELPAVSSTALRAGELGLEAVPLAGQAQWLEWLGNRGGGNDDGDGDKS